MGLKQWIGKKVYGVDSEANARAEKTGMDLIFSYIEQINAGGVWNFSEKTHAAEDEINGAYKAYIEGRAPLAELEAALQKWKELGSNEAK